MMDNADNAASAAAAEEIASLRAEVARLRAALEAHSFAASREHTASRSVMNIDPELPGLAALWRGERGLGWQLFVQAVVTVLAALVVITLITIAGS
jgi:hypothetical protein